MNKDHYFAPTLLFDGLNPGGDEDEELEYSQAGDDQGPNKSRKVDVIDVVIAE